MATIKTYLDDITILINQSIGLVGKLGIGIEWK